jgi:ribosomal 50S subunit-recycling heat shock protein
MKKAMTLGLMVLAALPAFAGAQEVTTGTKDGKPYFEASNQVTEQATVLAVDAKTRVVTLKTADGETTEVVAGEQVKNFAQIKANDVVKITYKEKLTIHVEGPGTLDVTTEKMTAAAKPGEKPSGAVTERTSYKALIAAIDKAEGTATLKDYQGKEFTITPLHPENLDKVSVGDLVVFTYTETVAASVEKVAAKPTAKPATKK